MGEIERYFKELDRVAASFVESDRLARDLMRRGEGFELPDLARLREALLAPQDRALAKGYLAGGVFAGESEDRRVAALLVCFELDDEIGRQGVRRRFGVYEQGQGLFLAHPELWSAVRDVELIDAARIKHLRTSGLVEVPGGWARLEEMLAPALFRWAAETFPNKPLFVRLDPWFAAREQPEELLRKAGIRPARSDWWSNLSLRNRERDGAHYVLESGSADDTPDEFYEYHVRGVRTLEVHAKRDKKGNLSMMIEELSEPRALDTRLFGRCIHLDTDVAPGAPADAAPVNHLDLAINVYFDAAAKRRRGMRLADGRVEDASVRTHLLRIEEIPFSASVEFARQFFESEVLLAEWSRDLLGAEVPEREDW